MKIGVLSVQKCVRMYGILKKGILQASDFFNVLNCRDVSFAETLFEAYKLS